MSLHQLIFLGGIYAICLMLIALLFFEARGKKNFSKYKLSGLILFFTSLPVGSVFFIFLVKIFYIPDIDGWQIWIMVLIINFLAAISYRKRKK
jgi:hypothetical protein